MEPKIVERPLVRFGLNMPVDLREELESYVERVNRRIYPAKMTMSDVVIAATIEYLLAHPADEVSA